MISARDTSTNEDVPTLQSRNGLFATDLKILLGTCSRSTSYRFATWTGPYRVSNHEQDLRWYKNLSVVVPSTTKEVSSMYGRGGALPIDIASSVHSFSGST